MKDNVKIKIVGVGDFGIELIKDFGKKNLPNVECLDINTEWAFKTANKFIKIGVNYTKGLGAGAQIQVGKKAAIENEKSIINAIKDCDCLIIVAGLGGGTGSGASPVIATIAKRLNIITICFVTTPLELEGKIRNNNAMLGLQDIKGIVDILFEFSDQKFLSKNLSIQNQPLALVYKQIDEILQKRILNVVDIINKNALIGKSIKEILKDIKSYKTSTNL